jgi:hypothetical protein
MLLVPLLDKEGLGAVDYTNLNLPITNPNPYK